MRVAKIMEITSESDISFEDATEVSVARAAKAVDHMRGAWGGVITGYRVDLKVTFLLSDE